MTKTTIVPHGTTNGTPLSARPKQRGQADPDRDPERGADQRGDRPPRARIIRRVCRRVIPTARSIPSSRVRSNTVSTSVLTIPNRRHDDREPEQDVEQVEELVQPLLLVVDELLLGLDLGVGERPRAPSFSSPCSRRVTPPGIDHEREHVLRVRDRPSRTPAEEIVTAPSGEPPCGGAKIAVHPQVEELPAGGLAAGSASRRPGGGSWRSLVGHDRALGAERCSSAAFVPPLPLEPQHLREPRIDAGDLDRLAECAALAGAHAGDDASRRPTRGAPSAEATEVGVKPSCEVSA